MSGDRSCGQVTRQTREYDYAAVRLQVDERELGRLQDLMEDVTRRQRQAHESEMTRCELEGAPTLACCTAFG